MYNLFSFALIGATVVFSPVSQVKESLKPDILCLGDSLTAGVGGEGTSWPCDLGALSGAQIINRGESGWIPRHLKYRFLLQDCPSLSVGQLRSIPPQEYENRIHQPKINNLHTFLKDGMEVKVRPDGTTKAEVVAYRWDGQSISDGEGFIRPDAVGNPANNPVMERGRWVRQSKGSEAVSAKMPEICVAWMGANGMQAEDVQQSLKEISTEVRQQGGRILVLGLINRMPSNSGDVADWGKWVAECNEVIQKDYPKDNLDLQAWFTSTGIYKNSGFRTRDWFPQATDAEVAADLRDQAAGVLPTSLRPKDNVTHINSTGYRIIAGLVYDALQKREWIKPSAH